MHEAEISLGKHFRKSVQRVVDMTLYLGVVIGAVYFISVWKCFQARLHQKGNFD